MADENVSPAHDTTEDAKLTYHAPVLRDHGSVDQLTKGAVEVSNAPDSPTGWQDPTPPLS